MTTYNIPFPSHPSLNYAVLIDRIHSTPSKATLTTIQTQLMSTLGNYLGGEAFFRLIASIKDIKITICQKCSNIFVNENLITVYFGGHIDCGEVCPRCINQYYTYFELESIYVSRDDPAYQNRIPRVIHNYSQNPLDFLSFKHTTPSIIAGKSSLTVKETKSTGKVDKGFFYLGVELEVSFFGEINFHEKEAKKILELLGKENVIIKTDGSITNGFEIVSAPASLDFHREILGWEKLLNEDVVSSLKLRAAAPGTGCGMHVHISKAPFTFEVDLNKALSRRATAISHTSLFARPQTMLSLNVLKMQEFLNNPINYNFVSYIIANRALLNNAFAQTHWNKGNLPKYNHHRGKYQPLNTGRSETLELRIFNSTLDSDIFFSNLEFTHALVHFSRDISIRHLNVPSFCEWVYRNSRQYPYLIKHLNNIPL